jgi:ribose/xylose/arabinose/galactoside ABC-type transport system permease subunit
MNNMVNKEKPLKKKFVLRADILPLIAKIDRNTVITIAPVALLLVIALVLGSITPNFLTIRNGINVLEQASVLALIAMGLSAVLITGGTDFSIPANLSLGAVIGAMYMRNGGNPIIGSAIMLLTCILIGLINGLSVSRLRIIPFVQTLAIAYIATGTSTALTGGVSVSNIPEGFINTIQYRVMGIPVYSLITIVLVIIIYFLFKKSIFGRWLYAVGTNNRAARVSGIPTSNVILGAYVFSGLMAGIGAIISVGRLLSASAIMAGDNLIMDIIASAVVGGVSIFGGVGNPLGAALGALLVILISNSMNMMRVSYFLTLVIKGLIILIFVWINSRNKK